MGEVLTQGAVVLCTHAGQAQPTIPLARVRLSGQAAVGASTPYLITGCTQTPPCVTAVWTSSAQRVRSVGVSLVLADSTGVCVPNGTDIVVAASGQSRVTASWPVHARPTPKGQSSTSGSGRPSLLPTRCCGPTDLPAGVQGVERHADVLARVVGNGGGHLVERGEPRDSVDRSPGDGATT